MADAFVIHCNTSRDDYYVSAFSKCRVLSSKVEATSMSEQQANCKCDQCGEEIPPKAKFCPECGVARKRPCIKPEGKGFRFLPS